LDAPIPISEAQLDDLRRIVLRTINKNQVLILTNIPRVPASVTSVLREISRRHKIPLSTLKRNAQILKEFNLIVYGDPPNFSGVELTELGRFISNLTISEDPTVLGNMVRTRSGLRPLGSVIRDLRKTVLQMIAEAGSGHLGASLSAVDILAVLYMMKMRHDPKNPFWPDRDRFILSKGHAAPALYAVLSEAGYISSENLMSLRALGSKLQGHPDIRTSGVDASTGSLGQGLSIGIGMALAAKMDGSSSRIYVLLGDGELDEGQVWEAALTASNHALDNLTAIVDRNGYQLTGRTEEIKKLESLSEKWTSFGWEAQEADGNDPASILDALNACDLTSGKPSVIIAHTTKGKGISFMEGNRYSRKTPDAQELKRALMELA
jgi:transketolase